jgi:hypothetical protein
LIWQAFNEYQTKLIGSIGRYGTTVDHLLYVLSANSEVYDKAAETYRITKNAVLFLVELESLIDIVSMVGSLLDTWSEVDSLVSLLLTLEFDLIVN